MDENNDNNYKKSETKLAEAKSNFKAGFYTLVIFAIIVYIWIYTNPFFNKPQVVIDSLQAQPETVARVDSISQSFKTMWSNVTDGLSNLKK